MSEQNVELVRRALEAYERGEMEAMLALVDPDLEWRSAIVGGAEGKVYRGPEGLRRWNADFREIFDAIRNEWTELRDLGDRVLAIGRVRARGRESGLEIDSPMGWVITVRDGRIVKGEGFLDPAEALEAAGLPD